MSSDSSTSNNNNTKERRKVTEQVINHQVSSNSKEILRHIGDANPNEIIVSKPDMAMEWSIKQAPPIDKSNSINFVRKSNKAPAATAAENRVQYDNLVKQVAATMRNGGSGVMPDFPADMSAEGVGQVYADAKELLKQEADSTQDEQAARREDFRRRLLASRPVCEACGLQISSWRAEAEDEHKEKCSIYQKQVTEKREFEDRRRNYERRWSKLIDRDIQNAASSLGEVADIIRELDFAANNAKFADDNNKDEAVLIALKNTKESFNNLSDYERARKYKMIESIRDSTNTIHNFFDKLETDEEDQEVTEE